MLRLEKKKFIQAQKKKKFFVYVAMAFLAMLSFTVGADLIGALVTSVCLLRADLGTNGSHSGLRPRLRGKSIPKYRPPRRVR